MGFIRDQFFGGGEKKAGEVQERSAREALDFQREQLGIERGLTRERTAEARELLEPFVSRQADPAAVRQAALSGALGRDLQSQAFEDFQESPGVDFLREQGLRLIESGAGARGGLGGGDRLRELTRFSQGLALQDFENQFNRLGQVSTGVENIVRRQQQAATGLGGFITGAPTSAGLVPGISNTIQGIGAAQAAGKLGQGAGFRGGLQQVASGITGAVAGGPIGGLQGFFGV